MKRLILVATLLMPLAALADGVTVRPATSTPEQLAAAAQAPKPSWELNPSDVSQRYLAIVQDRLGHLGTAEAEVRALAEAQGAQIEKMKKAIADLEAENARLKAAPGPQMSEKK